MTSFNSESDSDVRVTGETSSFSLWPLADLGSPTAVGIDPRVNPEAEDAAYQRGYGDGVRAANLDAEREILASLDSIRQALADAQSEREQERRVVEENAYAIAAAVARQIIHRELDQDSALIKEMVLRAIETVGPRGVLEIRMNADDLDLVREEVSGLDDRGQPRTVKWVPDGDLPRGSCLVETNQRLVDGGVDTSLARLYEILCHD